MRNILFASALLGLSAGVSAQAMPFPSLSGAPSALMPVAMGCGPGWTRGPYGGCHPMGYAGGGVYRHGYGAYAHPYYHPYAHPYYHPYGHRYYHPYYRR